MAYPIRMDRASPFFGTFLKLASFLHFTPFDVTKCKITEQYVLVRNRRKTLISATIHVFIVISNFLRVVDTLGHYINVRHDISSTFVNVSIVSTCGAVTMIQSAIWRSQAGLEKFIQMTNVKCSTNTAFKSTLLGFVTCFIITFCSFIHGLLTQQHLLGYVYVFKLFGLKQLTPSFSNQTWKILNIVFSSAGAVYSNMIITLALILALSFQFTVRHHFHRSIDASYNQVEKLLEVYHKMQEFVSITRDTFGSFIICYYVAVLSFLAELSQLLLTDSEAIGRSMMIMYAVAIFLTLGIACAAHTQVDKDLKKYIAFHHWESDSGSKERVQLIALMQELATKPIALSCSLFSLTSSFLGTMLGLGITYGIIVFQMTGVENAFWERDRNV